MSQQQRTRRNRFIQTTAMLTLLAFLPLVTTGCFGRFELTRKVYKFNKEVSDKWVQELVFLVFAFVPVYAIATFVDAIVVNSIEFWTGKNPALAGTTQEFRGDNGEVARATYREDGTVALEVTGADQRVQTLVLKRNGNQVAALDRQGRELGRVELGDDSIIGANNLH